MISVILVICKRELARFQTSDIVKRWIEHEDDFRYAFAYHGFVTSELALPTAWVVECKKCGCTVNCRAIDPQLEHAEPEKAEPPPRDTVIVTCSCCWAAYRYTPAEVFKGSPAPSARCHANRSVNNARNNKEANRPNSVLLIAASPIAAVRLNREEIKPTPVVYAKIADSIRLAEMIQARLRG
jgi:hypothetical protein